MKRQMVKSLYPIWCARFAGSLKARRLRFIDERILGSRLFDARWLSGKRLLDVGCGLGRDFIRFLAHHDSVEIHGVDLVERRIQQANFIFTQADAANLPFADKSFDLCVSFGVFEHISPMESLCKAASEIHRVAKAYVVVVPSIDTLLEPHTVQFHWQLKSAARTWHDVPLQYCSEGTWRGFGGFSEAKTRRFSYLPLLIRNLIIYDVRGLPS